LRLSPCKSALEVAFDETLAADCHDDLADPLTNENAEIKARSTRAPSPGASVAETLPG